MSFGWDEIAIGEVVVPSERFEVPIPGQEYRQVGVRLWGGGAYEREPLDGGRTKYKTLNRTEQGDIVVNKIWARNGSVSVIRNGLDGCYVSGEFPLFSPAKDRLRPEWFYWITRTRWFWNRCDVQSRGTSGKNRIRPEKFLAIGVPLPPVDEQQRIVAKIERLAARINEAADIRASSQREAQLLIRSRIREIGDDFGQATTLQEVLNEQPRNGWSPACDNAANGIPVLTLGAVTGYNFDPTAFKRTSLATDPNAHYWLRNGDLLITRSNTPTLVGHAAIYSGEPYPCIYPDLVMRIPVDAEKAYTRFVWYWLQAPQVREFIERNAKGTSPTMKKISQGTVMAIPFPKASLREQQQIVAELDGLQTKVEHLEGLQQKTAIELDALLPSILDKAFKGEL